MTQSLSLVKDRGKYWKAYGRFINYDNNFGQITNSGTVQWLINILRDMWLKQSRKQTLGNAHWPVMLMQIIVRS